MKSRLVFTVLLVVMLVSSMVTPLAVAQRPGETEAPVKPSREAVPAAALGVAPEGAGVESLTGSYVEFDPSVGGDVCYVPGMTQTFCFEAYSHSPDWEYVYNVWQKFPADWTVTNVYVQGTPYCENGGSWGSFSWSFQTSPYEVNISHARYHASVGDTCYAHYCFEVTSGTGMPEAQASWYWDGDGYGSTPHWPCSSDQYTPAGQSPCDEWINPQAAVPPCELDPIMLTPALIEEKGCPCEVQEHGFMVWNNTGYDTDVDLTYTITAGDGTCTGPASVYLVDGTSEEITVELYPVGAFGDEVVCEVYAEDASEPANNDTSWIVKELIEAEIYWEQIATAPTARMDNVAASYDDLVWSITGYGGTTPVNTYDPATNTWATVAGSAPPFGVNYARSGCHPYGSAAENKVFVYGDSTTSGFTGLWSYDMDANVWTNEAPSGTPPAQTGIWSPAWTYDPAEELCYLTGGATAPGGGNLTTVYVYDPVGNAWLAPLPNFTSPRAFHAAFMVEGMVCVMGGVDLNSVVHSSTQCYNGTSWNAENADIPALPMGWWGMGYADKLHVGTDLQLWLVNGADAAFALIPTTYYYDVNGGVWVEGGPLASGVFYRTAATNLNGELYHVGGSTGGFSYSGLSDRHVQLVCEPCPSDDCTWVELVVEHFEAWPPAGWEIVNYGGTCVWESTATTGRTNYAGGDGYAADADSDYCGSGTTMHTGLQSPHLDLSDALTATLQYVASYNYLSGDYAAVNISQSGAWTNLLWWAEDHDAYGPGELVTLDLPVGDPDALVEFEYYAPGWDWWFIVDQVVISACLTVEPPVFDAWKEAPAEAEPDDVIQYTITIEADQLEDLLMGDPLPAGVEYAGNLEWNVGYAWYDGDDNAVYWEYAVKGAGAPAASAPADTVYLGELVLDAPVALSAAASGPAAPPAPAANPAAVLWDQYANWNSSDYASQDFEDAYNVYDIFAADDFENSESWAIDTIVTRGGWGSYVDLNNATAINWWICPDNGGEPLCDPPGDGNEVWSISLPPSDSQVGLGVYENEDVVLTLDTPVVLPPGTWWLVYQASLEFSSYGQYGWSGTADPVWGSQGKQNNPGGGFGQPPGWWNNTGGVDYMFRLEGEIAEPPPDGVVVSFDVLVTGGCGEVILNEGWVTDGAAVVEFAAETEVVCLGEPDIVVTPEALDEELCSDTTTMVELEICNLGDAPLVWALSEVSGTLGVNAVLWDNGPLVTHPGGGYNGEDASALQTALGMNTYGFGNQYLNGYRMADDFEIADPAGWDIDTVTFFAYQTSSYPYPPPSTITGIYFQIWDGPPNDPGSSVVWGDLVTNRLQSTGWPNIYRVLDTDMLNTQRPPMATVATAGVSLPPGTYWLDWMTDGSGASGPWAPPISILGETTTGNAMQYTGAWATAVDTGLGTPQGMPFIIEGAGGGVDVPWLSEDPIEGVVQPDMCQVVEVTFDSTGMEPGDYFASLLIESNDPDTPEVNVPVTMTVSAPAEILAVTFEIDGLEVAFEATVAGAEPITFAWVFGDGEVSDEQNPVHAYAEAGCYVVTLVVSNACGEDEWTQQICVEVPCEPVDGVDFEWAPEEGVVGEAILFTALEPITGTAPFEYGWDFGDGWTGTGITVTHVFEAAGVYTVTLTVSNCGGLAEAEVWYLVTVEEGIMHIFLPVVVKNF